jgi:hypothetical protein
VRVTDDTPASTDAPATQGRGRNPYATGLDIAAAVAFFLAIALWVTTATITGGYGAVDEGQSSAMSQVATVALALGVLCVTASLVIRGVAWTLRRAGLDV